MSKYVIGVDYGTLSGRAVIADAKTGEEKVNALDARKTLQIGTQLE